MSQVDLLESVEAGNELLHSSGRNRPEADIATCLSIFQEAVIKPNFYTLQF